MRIYWREAKTYSKIAPHEYILEKDYPEFFKKIKAKIEKDGKDEPFTLLGHTNVYKYFYTVTYRYWIIENVLNRDSRYGLKNNPPLVAPVVESLIK